MFIKESEYLKKLEPYKECKTLKECIEKSFETNDVLFPAWNSRMWQVVPDEDWERVTKDNESTSTLEEWEEAMTTLFDKKSGIKRGTAP